MKVPELCREAASMAEVDPFLDTIMKRCTAGAPWTTVPVGTNTIGERHESPTALMPDSDA